MKANRNLRITRVRDHSGIALWKMKANRNKPPRAVTDYLKNGIALWKMKANRN